MLSLEMHDCSHKFLDDTKTCIQLFVTDQFGIKTSVVYVFTNDSQDKVKNKKEFYLQYLLDYIKENVEWH